MNPWVLEPLGFQQWKQLPLLNRFLASDSKFARWVLFAILSELMTLLLSVFHIGLSKDVCQLSFKFENLFLNFAGRSPFVLEPPSRPSDEWDHFTLCCKAVN